MFKAIFWDNDGIFVHTEPLYFRANREVLEPYGIIIDEATYAQRHMRQNIGTISLLVEQGVAVDEIREVKQKRDLLYAQYLETELPILPGRKEVLEQLATADIFMAVVTGAKQMHFDIIMKETGYRPYFRFAVTADDVKRSKPDPEPYLLALEKSGFQPEECLVIEDSERGIVSAKKAGLTCYALPNDFSRTGDLSAADKILSDISKIVEFFE